MECFARNTAPGSRALDRRGVTCVEVAVIGVVVVVLLLAAVAWIHRARLSARDRTCTNHLRQLGVGLRDYATAHADRFPPGTIGDPDLAPKRRWSWYLAVWPYVMPQTVLRVDRAGPWDGPGQRPVRVARSASDSPEDEEVVALTLSRCPGNPLYDDPERQDANSYLGMAGIGRDAPLLPADRADAGIWGYDRQTSFDEIKDGRGATFLLVETGLDNGPWMAGGPPTVRGIEVDEKPYVGPGRQFGGLHPGVCNVLYADGAVKPIAYEVDPEVFATQAAIADAQAKIESHETARAVRDAARAEDAEGTLDAKAP